MWRILNKAVGQSKKTKLTYLLVEEKWSKHRKSCQQYFTNVGPNLAKKLAPVSKSFQDFINSVPSDWLSSFTHVTAKELKTITKGFKDGKAPGADNILISIIKKALNLTAAFQTCCYQLLTSLCH